MTSISFKPRPLPIRPFAALCLAAACAAISAPVSAQGTTSREVVQALPSPQVQRLNRALMELARRPRRVSTLLEAGDASFELGDFDAAIGFYGRAADIEPSNARVKLGLARVYLRSGRPVEAIPLFNAARVGGVPARDLLSDQALAFDLLGDQTSAQTAYLRAIQLSPQDDEARRRLALSYAISGNTGAFETTLAPLLEARDSGAFRARAFGLAILGEQERAEGIANSVLPAEIAARMNPYLAYMPRLTAAQQAAAGNLGIFPRAADIGREDPRIARFASEGAAGSLLEPSGEPLGAPPAAIETVSQEVAQTEPEPEPAQPVVIAAAEPEASSPSPTTPPATTAQPGFDLARANDPAPSASLPDVATVETVRAEPVRPNPEPVPASVADAFADFGSADLPVASASGGAVDLAAIDIPREAAPEPEPEEPEHPRRIWVQLATGRDVDALAFDWRRFRRAAPDALDGLEPHVTPWGQANRLLAGPLDSRADARALINALAAKGVETFSYTSPEGTVIQQLR